MKGKATLKSDAFSPPSSPSAHRRNCFSYSVHPEASRSSYRLPLLTSHCHLCLNTARGDVGTCLWPPPGQKPQGTPVPEASDAPRGTGRFLPASSQRKQTSKRWPHERLACKNNSVRQVFPRHANHRTRRCRGHTQTGERKLVHQSA